MKSSSAFTLHPFLTVISLYFDSVILKPPVQTLLGRRIAPVSCHLDALPQFLVVSPSRHPTGDRFRWTTMVRLLVDLISVKGADFVICGIGECKDTMMAYMECMKKNDNASTECRHLSRDYLDCRMRKYVYPLLSLCDSSTTIFSLHALCCSSL